jgi:hypothetical protein
MRYVILAVVLYLAYLIAKSILRRISDKGKNTVEDGSRKKRERSYDIDQIQDAEFREVNKKD